MNTRHRGVRAQACDCNRSVVNSISTRGKELLFIKVFISSLWYQGKRVALGFALQHAIKNSTESGERSVLTLDCSACLPLRAIYGIQREAV